MKITKKQLKRIIQEEIGRALKEHEDEEMSPDDLQDVADEERRSWEADPEVDSTPLEVGDEVTYENPEDWTKPERRGEVVKEYPVKYSHLSKKRHGYEYKVKWDDGLEELVDGRDIIKNEAHP